MPVLVYANEPHASEAPRASKRASARGGSPVSIDVGLLNNMPDAALRATERQFVTLLGAAAEDFVVRLHLLALPDIPRGKAALARIGEVYAGIEALPNLRLDALIVTGNEPKAATLSEEPYWESLAQVVDWAEHNTRSTIWSCLAAHAAVLHLDGISRRLLPRKLTGVFDCVSDAGDPDWRGVPPRLPVAHSRSNDVAESDLLAHGYRIVTRCGEAGVDMFVKKWRSLFVFLQGHPEYDADSLGREYRRDVGRYLAGERDAYPDQPRNYFSPAAVAALDAFAARAAAGRRPELLAEMPTLEVRPSLVADWHRATVPAFRGWLAYLASGKA